MLARKILKSKDSNGAFHSIFRPKYGSFLWVLLDPERGGGGGGGARRRRPLLDPPLALSCVIEMIESPSDSGYMRRHYKTSENVDLSANTRR